MKHLYEINDWEKFLDGNLEIAQKVDGTNLNVVYKNNKLLWYGREGKKELDLIQRTVLSLYEDAINYLEDKVKKVLIQDNQYLSFEFFPSFIDPIIPVLIKPKNNLILLYSKNLDKTIPELAEILNVTPQPVIFRGKLTEKQKEIIKSRKYTLESIRELNPNFEFVINPLIIEGLIITNLDENKTYKMTDLNFTEKVKTKKQNKDYEYDEYYKIIMNIILNDFNVDIPKNYEYTPENYLNVLFNNIQNQKDYLILKYSNKFKKFDNGNKFKVPFAEINWKLIPKFLHKEMINFPWFKDFVRITLINLYKERKRETSNLKKDDIKKLNDISKKLLNKSRLYLFLEGKI